MPTNEFAFAFRVLGLNESTQSISQMSRELTNLATNYEQTIRRINQASSQNRQSSFGALNGGSFGGPINGSMSTPIGSAEQARYFERLAQNIVAFGNKNLPTNQQYNLGQNEFMGKLQAAMSDSGNILGQSIVRAMQQGSTQLASQLRAAFEQGAKLHQAAIASGEREAAAIRGHSTASGKSFERAFQEMHRVRPGAVPSFVGTLAADGGGRLPSDYEERKLGYLTAGVRTGDSARGGLYVQPNDAATLQHINRLAQESAYAFAQAFQKVTGQPVTRMADLYAVNPELASHGEAVGTLARGRLESAQVQANNRYQQYLGMGMSDDQAWARSRPVIQESLTAQQVADERAQSRSGFNAFLYNKTGTSSLGQYLGRSFLRTGAYAIDAAAIYGGWNLAHRGFQDVLGVQQHQLGLEQILPDRVQRARLVNGLYGQSAQYGEKPSEAMDVGYKMQSTFGNVNSTLQATNAVFLLSRTSTLALTEAMTGLVAITDAYGTGAKGMMNTVNDLIALQQKFGGSTKDNLDAMAKLGPLFSEYGISQQYGLAMVDAIHRSTGQQGTQVADRLSRIIPQFQNNQTQDVLARYGATRGLGFDYTAFAGQINAMDIIQKLRAGAASGKLSKADLSAIEVSLGGQRNSADFATLMDPNTQIDQRVAAEQAGEKGNIAQQRWKTLSGAAVNQVHQLDAAFLTLIQDVANAGLLQAFTLLIRGVTDLTKAFAGIFNDITMVTSALGPFGTALKAIAAIALTSAAINKIAGSGRLVGDMPLLGGFYRGRMDALGQPYEQMTASELLMARRNKVGMPPVFAPERFAAQRAEAAGRAAAIPDLLGASDTFIAARAITPLEHQQFAWGPTGPVFRSTPTVAAAAASSEAGALGALTITNPSMWTAFRAGISSSSLALKRLAEVALLAGANILKGVSGVAGTSATNLVNKLFRSSGETSQAEGGVLGFLQRRYVAGRSAQLAGTLGADGLAISGEAAGGMAAAEAAGMGMGGLAAFTAGGALLPLAAAGGLAYMGLKISQGLSNDQTLRKQGLKQTNANEQTLALALGQNPHDAGSLINILNMAADQGDQTARSGSTMHHLGRWLTGSNTPASIRWRDVNVGQFTPDELKQLGIQLHPQDLTGSGTRGGILTFNEKGGGGKKLTRGDAAALGIYLSPGTERAGTPVRGIMAANAGVAPELHPGDFVVNGQVVNPNNRLTTAEARKVSDILQQRVNNQMKKLSDSMGGLISPEDMLFRNQQLQASYQYGAPNVSLYGTGPQNGSSMKVNPNPATEQDYIKSTISDIGAMTKEMNVYLAQGDPQNKAKDIASKIDQLQQALITTLNASTQATAAYQAYFQGASGAAATQLAADQTILSRFPDQNSAEAMQQKLKVAQDYTAAISAPYDVQSAAATTLSGIAVLPQDKIRALQSIASAANGKARAMMAEFGDPTNSNVQQAMSNAITANKNVLDAINEATQQGIQASENLASSSTHNTLKQAAIKVKAAQDIIAAQQQYEGATSALIHGSTGNPVIDQFISDFQQQSQKTDDSFNQSISNMDKSATQLSSSASSLSQAAGALTTAAQVLAQGGAAAGGNIPYMGEAQGSFGANVDQGSFMQAIKMQESHGNYGAISPAGALGAYQIMPNNLKAWSQQVLGRVVSPQEFLHSPQIQDQIANAILGPVFGKYGPAGAASWWYSGSVNNVSDNNASHGSLGKSINSYVNDVVSKYNLIKFYQGVASQQNGAANASLSMGGSSVPRFGGGSNTISYIKALAASTGMSMIDTSDFRPGGNSYHALAEAVDFSNPGNNQQVNAQFASMMSQMFGKYLTELIWSGTGPQGSGAGQGAIFIKNGKAVDASFYGSAVGEHHNHVHVAIDPQMAAALSANGGGGIAGIAGQSPTLTNDFANLMQALYQQDMAKYQVDALKRQLGQSYSQGGQLIAQVNNLKEKAQVDLKWDDIAALYQDFLDFRQASLDLAKQRIQNTVNALLLKGDPSNQVYSMQVQILQAKQQMQAWLANGGNKNDNEYTSLALQVKNLQRDQALQQTQYGMTDLNYKYQMHQLGWGQYIQGLVKLRNTVDTSTRSGKELFYQINEQIQGLVDSLGQTFNISSNIALPTLYQVRRANTAASVGDASAFTNTLASTYGIPVYGTVPGVNYGTPGGAVNPYVMRTPDATDPTGIGAGTNHGMDLLHFQVNSQAILTQDQMDVNQYKAAQSTDQSVLLLYKYVLGWLKAHHASKSQIAAQQALVAQAVQKMNTDNAGLFYSTIQQKLDISRSQVALNTWQQHVKSLIQKTVATPHSANAQGTPWGVVNQVTINAQGANAQQVAALVAKNFGTQVSMVRTRNSTGTRYY